ncbi:prephenate dehydrogenase [Anaeroselena agilis]|uniref:Prephenate dehydrogenase/arogenate dehydrogenase family protein n=1 Tax=Anaeroselena agilis TaxID=3063788 RepID=A0ABU3NUP9_9FIRM|nr:prephenate dehydrogenase/arogenate dehydrogenase family protein [Selenomonadales bacterium 4137-cl]
MKNPRITIIGVGLIGGSLGLALKAAGLDVTGVDSDRGSLDIAVRRGSVDRATTDLADGVAQADVVFLCTPVLQIPAVVARIAPHLREGAIITDVGSTKRFIGEKITRLLPRGVHYVGGHPMAGREKSGIAAADINLFRDKRYIFTPAAATPPAAVSLVAGLIRTTGARVSVMDISHHDDCAAVISHVPHVVAAGLVNLLGRYPGEEENIGALAGGGFCDTTRIASSNADMWADICLTNPDAITTGIEELQAMLDEVVAAIRRGDRAAVHAFFAAAKARRDNIIASL